MNGHLEGPALWLGVAAGFAAAFMSAVSYLISRHHGSRGGSSLRLLVVAHALMGLACLPVVAMLWPATLPTTGRWIAPLVGSAFSYLLGQAFVFAALARADASRVAPLLGLKIAMLAGIVSCLLGEPLDLRQWLAVGLSVVAAAMLQRRGGMPSTALALTFAACCTFAISDLCIVGLINGLQQAAADASIPLSRVQAGVLAMTVTYVLCGCLAAPILMTKQGWPQSSNDWTAAGCYAVTWLIGMAALYTCFGLIGAVFGNILQSTRGVMAIVMGATLAHLGWHGIETHVDRQTLLLRIVAASLMTAAIALYVIDVA
ncbi:MAG: EamA family transporter [Pirellulales bacterium]